MTPVQSTSMTMTASADHASGTLRDIIRRSATLLVLVALVLAIVLLAQFGDIVMQRRVIYGLVNLVAVVGLYIFMGNSGVLNFSNVAFMAIGAYTSALLTMPPMMKNTFLPDLPVWLAAAQVPSLAGALAAGAVAGLVALVVGWPIMRLSGIGAAIATMSLLIICYIVLGNWNSLTGGQQSLMGLPAYVGLWTSGIWAMVAIFIAYVYQETRWAIALRASREDEVAARASGVRIVRQRLVAFVLSAVVSGVAGALFGHFLGTLRVENFHLDAGRRWHAQPYRRRGRNDRHFASDRNPPPARSRHRASRHRRDPLDGAGSRRCRARRRHAAHHSLPSAGDHRRPRDRIVPSGPAQADLTPVHA